MAHEVTFSTGRRDSVAEDIRLTKTQAAGIAFVVISLLFGTALGFAIHDHSPASCIATCAATASATFVLGAFLIWAGKHTSATKNLDPKSMVRAEKFQRYIMWTSLILSMIFAGNLAAGFHQGNVGCLATCASLTAATFMLAISIAAYRRKKMDYRVEEVEIDQKNEVEKDQRHQRGINDLARLLLIKDGKRVQGSVSTEDTTQDDELVPLLKIGRRVEAIEHVTEEEFKLIVMQEGMESKKNQLWKNYLAALKESAEPITSHRAYARVMENDHGHVNDWNLNVLNRAMKLHDEGELEVVEQVKMNKGKTIYYAIRRRLFDSRGNQIAFEEWSPARKSIVTSLQPYFK